MTKEADSGADLRDIARDPTAFEAYYRGHVEAVQNFLARRLTDPHKVADLTADVFLAAMGSAHTYRPGRGSPLAWTYGIARNVLNAELRRSGREQRAVGRVVGHRLLGEDDIARLEERIDAQAMLRRMLPGIDELPDGERAVLELIAIDGFSTREVAVALGISVVTARVRLHRVRRHLRPYAEHTTDRTIAPHLEVSL